MNDFELLHCKTEESIMEDIMRLCDVVRETGFAIHRYHKHGHLEKVYENALAHRLRKLGLDVKQQYPLKAYDEDGTLIGDYSADVFVATSANGCGTRAGHCGSAGTARWSSACKPPVARN
jgi:uncharacterized protein (UPF0371 family)